jgi:formylglycine-generating enzyme required for sulfatase activity
VTSLLTTKAQRRRGSQLLCVYIFLGCAGIFAGEAPKPGDVQQSSRIVEVVAGASGIKFAFIPAGEFDMGSPADEKGREEEETKHRVKISKPFRMSTTEITQAQWKALMGQRRGEFDGENLPVESATWKDAVAFCEKLSQVEGKKCRLPTEAEWEYACRAGATGRFSGGEKLDELAWYDDNAEEKTHPVASKKPNAWGLYDMHGNVAEWCADFYVSPYAAQNATDPTGPAQGTGRVIRGGSWSSFERGCRSASRSSANPAHQPKTVGVRVLMEVEP